MNKIVFKSLFVVLAALFSTMNIACAHKGQTNKGEEKEKGSVIILTDSMFKTQVYDYTAGNPEWKYLGDKPAIIDFYADWCGPCKKIAPILQELAEEYKDSIVIYKVNVDKERTLAGWAQIQSIPAVLFIPMNDTPQMMVGQQERATYVEAIEKFLLKK